MDEMIDVVDEKNEVISEATRSEVHKKGLWHRGVSIIVKNSKGEILLQMRSSKKETSPNLLCLSASGHVSKGQSYWEAAKRELEEEIGISTELLEIDAFDQIFRNSSNNMEKEKIKVFSCIWEGDFKFQDGEVEWVKFFKVDELKRMLKEESEKFAPTGITQLKRYLKIE